MLPLAFGPNGEMLMPQQQSGHPVHMYSHSVQDTLAGMYSGYNMSQHGIAQQV